MVFWCFGKLKLIQSVQDKQTDIELFVDLVRQFPVIWNARLNGFKD